MKFSKLPQAVGLLKLLLKVISHNQFQWSEGYLFEFVKYTFRTDLCVYAFEFISLKLGLILVLMTLTFTVGHRVVRKLEFVQSFCYKMACSSKHFVMVDNVKHMIAKTSCEYGNYRLSISTSCHVS